MQIDAVLGTDDLLACEARAAELEARGFAGAWSIEGQHDPFLPLALAARATTRLGLGTAIAVAFARNPMTCAQVAWDLQAISRGRFVLGLGTQIRPHIERRFSQPWSRPAARMREFTLAIRAIWRAWGEREKLDFRGEFYTHTLMTPFFDPGPNPFGAPRIFLAGVGPRTTEVAGEVGDGFFVHPFHSPEFLRAATLPALERGLARAGRARRDYTVSCQTIVAMGADAKQVESARRKARGQISFYGSTPSYRGLLEQHGRPELQPELNRLSKQGRWAEMAGLVDDALFDAIAVSGTPAEVGRRLRERNAAFADRTTLMLYDETGDPEAVVDLLRAAATPAP
jgi:probable F420-dependent oxidoreductase